ncbi:MAG: PhzF family phenazine biosynthesis isomerase [Steroidobacteraceae bacterium]
MSRIVRIFQVDAFTDTQFSGNPAGVVLHAEQLSEAEMQSIARELNNGDTAFVLPATASDHDIGVRFFTPRKEAPFVGHATLAAHAVLARTLPQALRRQKGQTGIVEVQALEGNGGFSIRQPAPPLGRTLTSVELDQVLQLLGLTHGQLDVACPARIAGSASTRLLLGVRDSHVLDVIRPQLAALGALSAQLGAQGYFIFTRNPSAPGCATEARMFCPALGIDEDPVSGNAHAMLGVYLVEHALLAPNEAFAHFTGAQGAHVGRPGRVMVSVELDAAGKPTTASIAGQAVVVFEASLRL